MESEYIAMFSAANHLTLLFALEDQFGLSPAKPNLWCDNQSAISIATGGGMNFKRSRFMNVKYHWVRKAYEDGEFAIDYIKSEENMADLLTKRLPPNKLKELRGYFLEIYSLRDDTEFYEDSETED